MPINIAHVAQKAKPSSSSSPLKQSDLIVHLQVLKMYLVWVVRVLLLGEGLELLERLLIQSVLKIETLENIVSRYGHAKVHAIVMENVQKRTDQFIKVPKYIFL